MTQVVEDIKPEKSFIVRFEEFPELVSIKQLRNMLGISNDVAYEMVKSGTIRSFKIGKKYRVPKSNIIEYVEKQLQINQ